MHADRGHVHAPHACSSSRAIHSRMYGGQFRSAMPSLRSRAKETDTSRSTRTTSLRSMATAHRFREQQHGVRPRRRLRSRPITVNTTSPLACRWIFSIDPRGARTKQTRDQRKMLNLNCFDGLFIGEISPMVNCWTTIDRLALRRSRSKAALIDPQRTDFRFERRGAECRAAPPPPMVRIPVRHWLAARLR